ncbi:MAG: HAMP domain-containing sensor histidine kinase, partial [Pirellulaceae bacterium]
HKLGNRVEMVTRAAGKKEVVVTIDWTDFDSDAELESIPVAVKIREPKIFTGRKHGTRIEIGVLRDQPWTRRRVRQLHRAVNSICSPTEGPGSFVASLELTPDPKKWLADLPTAASVMKSSLFRVKGRITGNGIVYDYQFRPPRKMDRVDSRSFSDKEVDFPKAPIKKGETVPDAQQQLEDERFISFSGLEIGDIAFDFSIFDRDRQTLSLMAGDSKTVTDFLDQNGGVKVYRDGVRVYDFGEEGNDWLDLGGRRVNVPSKRIGNNQVIGTIELDLDASQDLREKTNREGFVENQAYVMFRRAVRFAVKQAESERNLDKERIRKAYAEPKQKEPVLGDLASLRTEITALHLDQKDDDNLKKFVDQIDTQYREILDRLLTAAGAGLNLAIVLHEIEKNIKTLHELIQLGTMNDEVKTQAKDLADMVDTLTWLTRQSGKAKIDASELIDNCLFAWRFRFNRHNIVVVNGMEGGDPPFSIKGNRRLVMTAFMNLIDNAIYWVSTKTKNRRIYLGTTYELRDKPALLVADNGPGFTDPTEYLTMAFFTRKPDGMGLGLHLADEIMSTQGGRVAFAGRGEISLPKEFTGAAVLLEFDKEI